MQKTSFPFEVLIHDDASTDETADIIREYEEKYPLIIKPIYQTENQYSKHVDIWGKFQCPRAKGKYIAICEGDDYWIDPLKLQKQVDYLETHTECGMIYTKVRCWNEKKKKFVHNLGRPASYDSLLLNLQAGSGISTLSVCARESLFAKYWENIRPEKRGWRMGDYPIWLFISYLSYIHYIDDITAVYRVLEESASHFSDIRKTIAFIESTRDVRLFFCENYPLDNDKKECVQRIELQTAYAIFAACIKANDATFFYKIKGTLNKYKYMLTLKQRICVSMGLSRQSGLFLIRLWYKLRTVYAIF
jgi:glycosyltransferase involved in cell wall biosynthesis